MAVDFAEEKQLRDILDAGMTVPEIAPKLKCTTQAIYSQLQRLYRKRRPSSASRLFQD